MPAENNSPHGSSQQQQQQRHGNPILLIKKPVSAVVGASWLYPFKVPNPPPKPTPFPKNKKKTPKKRLTAFPTSPLSLGNPPWLLGNNLFLHPPFPLTLTPNTAHPRLLTFHLRPLQPLHLDLSTSSRLPRHLPRTLGMGSSLLPRPRRRSRDRGLVI